MPVKKKAIKKKLTESERISARLSSPAIRMAYIVSKELTNEQRNDCPVVGMTNEDFDKELELPF